MGGVNLKIVLSDSKKGQSFTKEVAKEKESVLVGHKVGEKVQGAQLGLAGYLLEITGGSDAAGFPLRKDIAGMKRTKIVIGYGVGRRHSTKGNLQTRTVSGGTIAQTTSQINLKVVEYGQTALDQLGFVSKPKEAKKEKA